MGGTKERGGERRVLELSRPSRGRRGTKTTKTKAKGGYGCPSCLGFGVLVARRALEEESDEMAGRGGKERCVELVLAELLRSKQIYLRALGASAKDVVDQYPADFKR